MTITVVTTFHPVGMEKYGQRFLDSFAKHVDKNIKLIVYAEDCTPVNPDPRQIVIQDARATLPKLNAFKHRWKDVPKANGDISADPVRRRRKDSNKAFKWDAVRFANKVYAVFDACAKREGTWIVWMDADTVVHSDWSFNQFKNYFPSMLTLHMLVEEKEVKPGQSVVSTGLT